MAYALPRLLLMYRSGVFLLFLEVCADLLIGLFNFLSEDLFHLCGVFVSLVQIYLKMVSLSTSFLVVVNIGVD